VSRALPLSRLLSISRPRFWIYLFGPYIVGLASGAKTVSDFFHLPILLFALYFTLPANLLVYGVNDIFDYETDRANAKKTGYESLVPPDERAALWRAIAFYNLPFLPLLFWVSPAAVFSFCGFAFFGIAYSAPPRFKTKPLLDSASNVLYIFPGLFAFFLIGGDNFQPLLFVAAWCWAMAMHAYSAVPDISADRSNGLNTIATWLGFRGTMIFCLFLYISAAALSIEALQTLSLLLGAVYAGLMLFSLSRRDEADLLRVYRWFPLVNTLCGMTLFFAACGRKFF
jgi:4-hydroxybenzoate polyprenyltransferase